MHKKIMIIMCLFLLVTLVFFAFYKIRNNSISVEASKAGRVDIVQTIQVSGTLKANDNEDIFVPNGQTVIKTLIKENQMVTKGQVLAELDTGDLTFQIKKEEIAIQQLKDELSELEDPTTVSGKAAVENQMVQAENSFRDIQRKLKESEDKLNINKQLYNAGSLSLEDYKAGMSDRDSLANSLSQASTVLQDAKNAYNDYDQNRAISIHAKERQIETDNADLKSLAKKIADSTLKASIDGLVSEFPLKEGRLPENDSIIRIFDLTHFKFEALVPQEDSVKLSKGQPAIIKLKGLTKEYKAAVDEVKRYAMADTASGSRTPKVKVTLSLFDTDNALAAGFDADAVIETGRRPGVLALRREDIRKGSNGNPQVFAIYDSKAKLTDVVTGLSDDYFIEIQSGIQEGELIATNPKEELRNDMQVNAIVK